MFAGRIVITGLTVAACLAPAVVYSQPGSDSAGQPGFTRKSVEIPRTNLSADIDGVLDDEIWQQAAVVTDFHQTRPVDQAQPTQESVFYVTYNEDFFYVGARLYDTNPEDIAARVMRQGESLRFDDNIHVILDTFNNRRTAFRFITNPNAVRDDGVYESQTAYNIDWSGIWFTDARIDDEGWTAEMAIPFTTLNFDPATDTWGLNLIREIARNNERIVWSSFNRAIDPSTAGLATGIRDIEQGLGLDIVPSVTAAAEENHVTGATDNRVDPSLDVFYKFTPNLTGALTVNTDFSATEVDDRQVNLTRFSLFFPEKRDFFLQDSEIFSFGGLGAGDTNGIPFYSRRIGLDAATGQPVDLDVGAKLAGRVGDLSVGTLLVQQGDRLGLDESRLFVGRVTQNVLAESRVGAIFTDGDPNSDTDNRLAGVDFLYRNTRFSGTHTMTGEFWYQQTDTAGIDGDDKAYSMNLDVSTENNGVSGFVEYDYIGDRYNPALGFANRRGIEQFQAEVNGRYFLEDHPQILNFWGNIDFSRSERLDDGSLQSERVTFQPLTIDSHEGDRVYLEFVREREGLQSDFAIRPGIVIPAGEYSFTSFETGIQTSNVRTFSPDFSYGQGDFYNGESREISFAMNWQPGPRFTSDFRYIWTDVELPQGEFISRLISLDATVAFSSSWSWVNLFQYDNFSDTLGINSRLHWVPRAGEDLYLVINYNFDADGAFRDLNARESEIALKYTRNFRF